MKFKLIFIVFNIVILISFALIFFMPLMLLGWGYTQTFWSANWYLPLLFLLIIGILNGYFLYNWRLFTLLEQEDWKGLSSFLENRVYTKRRISSQNIRLLIHAYVVLSDIESIGKLEKLVRDKQPSLFKKQALLFGIPHLLKNSPMEMEEYFRTCIEMDCEDLPWLKWNRAFSLIMQKREEEGKGLLLDVVKTDKEPVLLLLTAYLLDAFSSKDSQAGEAVKSAREKLTRRYTRATWGKEVEKSKGNLQAVILIRLIEEAADWLFKVNLNQDN